MRPEEAQRIAAELGGTVVRIRNLAGGFSHETCLLTLTDGEVVVRLGGADAVVEAAVMALAASRVPVPRVLRVLPEGDRPVMIVEYAAGTPLSVVLRDARDPADLGAEVGRVAGRIGALRFERPGFFADASLTVPAQRPWSQQLPEVAADRMARTSRLDEAVRRDWLALCAEHAPALVAVDGQAQLVHGDINPKNILVSWDGSWRVSAVLDWEFSYSGCPYGDAANMARFGDMYPAAFLEAFIDAFGTCTADENWLYLGRVLDMFSLSDLVTRPGEHLIADQAAAVIRRWVRLGIPST